MRTSMNYAPAPGIIDFDELDEYTHGSIRDLISWSQDQDNSSVAKYSFLKEYDYYYPFACVSSVSGLIDQVLSESYESQMMIVTLLASHKIDVWDLAGIFGLITKNNLDFSDFIHLKFNTNKRFNKDLARSRVYHKIQDQLSQQNLDDVFNVCSGYREMRRKQRKKFIYLEPFIALLFTEKERNHFLEVMNCVVQLEFDVSYYGLLELFDHCIDNSDFPVSWTLHLKKAESLKS